jgi:hypothetical protein
MTDKTAILKRVRQAFAGEPRIGPGFRPVRLDIDDEGILLVDGEVDSVPAKKLVLEHATALRGVSGVLDRVRVKPASAMGDDEIRAHLLNAYSQEPAFLALELRERSGDSVVPVRGGGAGPLGAIEYEVVDGVVTLNGEVPGLDSKRLAGLLAWWVRVRATWSTAWCRPVARPTMPAPSRRRCASRSTRTPSSMPARCASACATAPST